jgi:hypothetical protein
MDKKELKRLIKPLIKELLTEIFCELRLETIVENIIKKTGTQPRLIEEKKVYAEQIQQHSQMSKEELRAKLLDKVGASSDEMRSIYTDIIDKGHPVLDGNNMTRPEPELVPESVLREAGLLRDFSKFIK